jgi:tripartite ATP-independent transporter DctM subunit
MGLFIETMAAIVVLMLAGVPIAFSLLIVSVAILILKGYPLGLIPHMIITGVESWVLLAVPLFILTGHLMNATKLTDKIFDFANACLGHIRGGMGHVTILANMIFAGISGAALADVQGLGVVTIKAMTDKGYDKEFAAAVTVSASTIGPIIPPSIPMVIYAAIAEVSVAKMFLAGFLPGFVMGLAMMILVYLMARSPTFSVQPEPRQTLRQVGVTFVGSLPSLVIPGILLLAILLGIATPTEIGVISILYIVLVVWFGYKALDWAKVWSSVRSTAEATAAILIILGTASLYAKMLAMEQVPQTIATYVLAVTQGNPIIFLLAVNILLLILGCFLDTTAIMVITLPILLPIAKQLHIDLIHFGITVVFNLMIGLLTPPFGLCLYAVMNMTKIPMDRMVRAVLPFFVPLLVTLAFITFAPKPIMFLPNLSN